MWSQWSYEQTEDVGLIVVELPSLDWRVIEYGPEEPTYMLADGGTKALVHPVVWSCDGCSGLTKRLEVFDLLQGTRTPVTGPFAALDQFVTDADERRFWVPDGLGDVIEVDVTTAHASRLPISWTGSPDLVAGPRHDGPQPFRFVLGERERPTFYVVGENKTQTVQLTLGVDL